MKKDIYSYLSKYGKYSFNDLDINNADVVIFSLLSYMNFCFASDKEISIIDAVSKWKSLKDDNRFKGMYMMRRTTNLPNHIVNEERFNSLKIVRYKESICKELDEQFAAITILLPNKRLIISYMGSDNSLFGWKENLNMAYCDSTLAQLDALSYLDEICNKYHDYEINICGYSKGGNLGFYAFLNSNTEIKNRIKKVYLFDSPGLYDLIIGDLDLDKIELVIPRGSMVGKLLKNIEYRTIKSRNFSIFQHEISSWIINDKDFKYLKKPSNFILLLSNTVNKFVYKRDRNKIHEYIDELFMNFESKEIILMGDIRKKVVPFIKCIIPVLIKANREYKNDSM